MDVLTLHFGRFAWLRSTMCGFCATTHSPAGITLFSGRHGGPGCWSPGNRTGAADEPPLFAVAAAGG
ncbi:hypothetical protein [Amycolatopsis jiangsuensis]|uniref:Uncharacterized protein n=1 Tax=Amycolatopsis jiangsuensis TaxID=1181879 RepID=A0A840J0L9_9PSEU|nr:hypothetical protein [Amycolatopsis jiangsuensis]MBB4686948.1 hypothetical protein [Amycolatopsis jiangsuensis]